MTNSDRNPINLLEDERQGLVLIVCVNINSEKMVQYLKYDQKSFKCLNNNKSNRWLEK